MQPTNLQDEITATKQAQLAENLAKIDRAQARRHAKAAPPPPSEAVTLEDHILEATDDILRVSAGLQSLLTLLELQSDTKPQSIGLHALLLPLRQQLIESADRLQTLV